MSISHIVSLAQQRLAAKEALERLAAYLDSADLHEAYAVEDAACHHINRIAGTGCDCGQCRRDAENM